MNPAELLKMLKKCRNIDFVFASRYLNTKNSGSQDDNFITFIGNKFFSFLGRIFFNLSLSDILYTYIIGKTNSFRKLDLKSNDFRLCVEIPLKIKKYNLKYTSVASYERKRIGGVKKVNALKDGFLILLYIIKMLFIK
jgi:hypothetical protein